MVKMNSYNFSLQKDLYSIDAIKKASSDFDGVCEVNIDETESSFEITLTSEEDEKRLPLEFSNFCLGYMKDE